MKRPEASPFHRLRSVAGYLVMACTLVACGDGGSSGGGSADLQVLEEVPFLLSDGTRDPRTGDVIQFILRNLKNPEIALTEDDIEVRRNGQVDVESRVLVNPPDVAKSDLTLVLDVSSSLTPDDLEKVKKSAKEFAEDLLPLVRTLRIYYFSSPSQTVFLGEYDAVASGDAFVWNPNPDPAIDGIPGGVDSTALFHAVRTAILGDEERNDILVVFSDGQENSSPFGAEEEALTLIEDEEVVVFSVGFGSVDSEDLKELSRPFGAFLGVKPSLNGLFAEVAAQVQSIYTIVYDTPAAFGTQKLDVTVKAGRQKMSFSTSFEAGIDFVREAYVRYPSMPGSSVELIDYTAVPPATIGHTVLATDQAVVGVGSAFAFAIRPDHECPGIDCTLVYQAPIGDGARSETGEPYLPAVLDADEEVSWTDPVTGSEFLFTGFEELEFFRGTPDKMRLMCARVTFDGGTHWFAKEVGLVRTENFDGDVMLDLAAPPCLSENFDGGCNVVD
jgi:hypothetical protein